MRPEVRRVLIANRGEIAVRLVRACFDEGLHSVLAVSAADRDSLAARLADQVIVIGPGPAADSYLSVDRVLAAARVASCDALHPGYGFLSERPELAAACEEEKITFVGPPSGVLRRAGDKLRAREVAAGLGIPTGGGTDGLGGVAEAVAAAERIDAFPYLLKASAGGGGRGMVIVRDAVQLRRGFETASREAERAFGDGTLYLERFVERARHVEVQILADHLGHVIHLGERDCSTQRRYQKLVEESPAVGLPGELIAGIRDAAVRLARALGYVGAGTVEFLVDADRGEFIFLEVNARVQVEHPVTELVTGTDIVRWQLRIAAGQPLTIGQQDVQLTGHAVECRLNAEDPARGFLPSPGVISRWTAPQAAGLRIDTYAESGAMVPPFYDSLIAKVITHAATRPLALDLLRRALGKIEVTGPATTRSLYLGLLADPEFCSGPVTTRWLEEDYLPRHEQELVT